MADQASGVTPQVVPGAAGESPEDLPVVLLAHVPHRAAGAALEAAIRQAQWRGARLLIVNALTIEQRVQRSEAPYGELKAMAAKGRAAGVPTEFEQPVGPDVATMILNRVHGLPADVVVIGTRRRSTVGKVLMGSIAQRLVMEADCEVLVVKNATP